MDTGAQADRRATVETMRTVRSLAAIPSPRCWSRQARPPRASTRPTTCNRPEGGADARGVPLLPVFGYAIEGLPMRILARDAHALAFVGVDGVVVHRDGRQVDLPSHGAEALLNGAQVTGLKGALLVSNFDAKKGDFNTATAGKLLNSRANSARVADRLAHVAQHGHWDGITVDLEALRHSYAPGLVRFVRMLDARLPGGTTLDIDLSAATHYRSHGYNIKALLHHVDRLVVMAYDQHGPTWSGPGPVGSLQWQRESLEALLKVAPADRVDLGVAGYGYTWPSPPHQHEGRSVSPRQARQLAADDGVEPQWRPRAGEWFVELDGGTRMWRSDARSWQKCVDLARRARPARAGAVAPRLSRSTALIG